MLGLIDRYFRVLRFCQESLWCAIISEYVPVWAALGLGVLSCFVLQTGIVFVDWWNRTRGWVRDLQSLLLGHLRGKSLVGSRHNSQWLLLDAQSSLGHQTRVVISIVLVPNV